MSKVRTTVIVEESVIEQAKKLAFEQKKTFTQLLEDSLRMTIRESTKPYVRFADLPCFGEGGLLPGIDLEDKDMMDEIERKGGTEWSS